MANAERDPRGGVAGMLVQNINGYKVRCEELESKSNEGEQRTNGRGTRANFFFSKIEFDMVGIHVSKKGKKSNGARGPKRRETIKS